jgi:hypothetical protein
MTIEFFVRFFITLLLVFCIASCSKEYSPRVATDCSGKSLLIAAHMERCTHEHPGACYMQAADELCSIVEIQQ